MLHKDHGIASLLTTVPALFIADPIGLPGANAGAAPLTAERNIMLHIQL